MLAKKINDIKIDGGRNDFPVIALGQYSVGQGASKVYPTTSDVSINQAYGVNGTSLQFERPSGTLIAVGDPNSDVGQYIKFTNKALSIDGSSDPYGNLKGLQIETRNQGKLDHLYALQTQARTSAGTGYEATNITGHYLEVKVDPSATAPTTLGHTNAVLYCAANAPANSYGVQAYNSTDGTYTYPQYGFIVNGSATHGLWKNGFAVTTGKVSEADFLCQNDVAIFTNAGVPSDGTSGEGAGFAGPGAICVDYTNSDLYVNANTKASPTWKLVTRAA